MANVKISDLPAAATLAGTEPVPIVQSSATVQTTTQDIANLAAGGSVANPTAQVGLSAVNGVATTAIRSDGAPALDQGIEPTWTGQHDFVGGVSRDGFEMGYLGYPQTTVSGTGDYTLAAGDNGTQLYRTDDTEQAFVIPLDSNVELPIGYTVQLANGDTTGTGIISVSRQIGVTLYLAGTTTDDDYQLAGVNLATLEKVDTDTWIIWPSANSSTPSVVNLRAMDFVSNGNQSGLIINHELTELSNGEAIKINGYGEFDNFELASRTLTFDIRVQGSGIAMNNQNVTIPAESRGAWVLDMLLGCITGEDGAIYYIGGSLTVTDSANGNFLGSVPIGAIGIGVAPGDTITLGYNWNVATDGAMQTTCGSLVYLKVNFG